MDNRRVSSLLLRDRAAFSLGDVDFVFVAGDGLGESTGHQGQSLPAAEAPPPSVAQESLPAPEPAPAAVPPAPLPFEPETPSARVARPEEVIARFKQAREAILAEIGKVIIGQRETLHQMLAALFARGHCLLIGVPGLAKTLMVKTLGNTVDLQSKRIQFTPDLMPSDITGTDILEEDSLTGKRNFRFHRGPLFTNLLLADEINRTPPKTQAALLEAMQEHRVTVSGSSYDLPEPFMVLATQNPIEQEGTYPLPEAQLDRFMFNTFVDYPSESEELEIVKRTTADTAATVTRTLASEEILTLQRIVRRVPVAEHVSRYAVQLARLSRPQQPDAPGFVKDYVTWGAGPRASQYMVLGAKARAVLYGRCYAGSEDVAAVAHPVLRHRIMTNFNAEAEGIKPDEIIRRLLETVHAQQDEATAGGKLPQLFRSADAR